MIDLNNLFNDGEEMDEHQLVSSPMEAALTQNLMAKIAKSKSGLDAAGFATAYEKINKVMLERTAYFQMGIVGGIQYDGEDETWG